MKTTSSRAEVVEFLRSRERATYAAWRATPGGSPELGDRANAWRRALSALNAEVEHRAAIVAQGRAA
jgi:hypothetical protein